MKSKVPVLGLVFSLLVCSGNLVAKERRGAEVKILKNDWTVQKGELIAVKPASLLLMEPQSYADVSVDIEDIIKITVVRKSKALAGFLIGIQAGLGGALVIGLASSEDDRLFAIYGAGLMVLASPLIGLIAGALMGSEQTIRIVGRSPEQIKADLEKLRRQARIPNFQ